MQTGSKGNGNKENRLKVARPKGGKRAKRSSKGTAGTQIIDVEVTHNSTLLSFRSHRSAQSTVVPMHGSRACLLCTLGTLLQTAAQFAIAFLFAGVLPAATANCKRATTSANQAGYKAFLDHAFRVFCAP